MKRADNAVGKDQPNLCLSELRFQRIELVFHPTLIASELHHILNQKIKLSLNIFHAFLNIKNLRQGALPDWFRVVGPGFQNLHASIKTSEASIDGVKPRFHRIKPRLHRVEPGVNGGEPRFHRIKPREYALFKRAVIGKLSRAVFAHRADYEPSATLDQVIGFIKTNPMFQPHNSNGERGIVLSLASKRLSFRIE